MCFVRCCLLYIIAIKQNAATNLTIQTAYYCVVLLTIRQYAFVIRLVLCGLLLSSYVALFYCIAIKFCSYIYYNTETAFLVQFFLNDFFEKFV